MVSAQEAQRLPEPEERGPDEEGMRGIIKGRTAAEEGFISQVMEGKGTSVTKALAPSALIKGKVVSPSSLQIGSVYVLHHQMTPLIDQGQKSRTDLYRLLQEGHDPVKKLMDIPSHGKEVREPVEKGRKEILEGRVGTALFHKFSALERDNSPMIELSLDHFKGSIFWRRGVR